MAQLQLAERIIAEKEHELHEVVVKADQFMMEKEFLEEELATVKTSMNVSGISPDLNATGATSPPPTNRVRWTTRVGVCVRHGLVAAVLCDHSVCVGCTNMTTNATYKLINSLLPQ